MENDNGKNKDPHFIKEVVKEKKNRKKTFLKVLFVLVVAAGVSAVSAVIFAFTYHGVSDSISSKNQSASSSKTSSEEADSSSSSTGTSVSVSSVSSESSENTAKEKLTIDDYNDMRNELRLIAQDGRKSLVTVTGVTSSLDYFNEPYENEKMDVGLIISESSDEYFILAYSSVLSGAEKIKVDFSGNYSVDGSVVKSDSDTGLAVVKVEKSDIAENVSDIIKTANLTSSFTSIPGDSIIVIGNPDGYDDYIAFGAITSTSNTTSCFDNEYRVLTTDVPDGASGLGVILDTMGRVIGITSQSTDSISNATVTALSVSDIKELIDNLSNGKSRAYAGIKGYDVTEKISQESGLPEGVIAVSLAENSPALLSGMMEYDIITSVDGNEIRTMTQFSRLIKEYEPGAQIGVSVMRQTGGGYAPVDLTIQLGEV